ncbi:3-carboxy-cis,cis-muconate cycloisomerase [Mycobacterium sp. CBMA271]|uniref:lyase family protein n=1 Tax=unclassified Mycobacteroides TaxID=2618759 RepID=UPI0012DC8477|nr:MULTISPECIES: lyase family protein [unclassified Mycobacteroides]MUM16816.1 3-carboxy-cis,cis-muconate cycloisomerase [Mycobacteroides sp. CBMA 326]MUM20289.1 3-carboxy-cis,cis-muconate cycloisomerase [Mycobacteroides sp. CBMA 271]
MTNLLWPGDHRAGALMSDETLLDNMIRVETAWLGVLARAGIAPAPCAGIDLHRWVHAEDRAALALAAEDTGNPVPALVALLRQRAGGEHGRWIHRGLTSQDVLDTALMLAFRSATEVIKSQLSRQASALITLAERYRETPTLARTLTQPAVPTTFGVKAAVWLDGVVDAYERIMVVTTPIQIGSAGGTRSAIAELLALRSTPAAQPSNPEELVETAAAELDLDAWRPWHTARAPVTNAGDALVGCVDVWGRIASDVVTMVRPEIGELTEPGPVGRGGSSTMPQKRNPILSILIRRAAISAPQLSATLHVAAAFANDERPDGAWHAEWEPLRTLTRQVIIAGDQCAELLSGLQVHAEQMAANLARFDVLAEQRVIAELSGKPASETYLGECARLVDGTVERARRTIADL